MIQVGSQVSIHDYITKVVTKIGEVASISDLDGNVTIKNGFRLGLPYTGYDSDDVVPIDLISGGVSDEHRRIKDEFDQKYSNLTYQDVLGYLNNTWGTIDLVGSYKGSADQEFFGITLSTLDTWLAPSKGLDKEDLIYKITRIY